MKRQILITNDDGIGAEGIHTLARIAGGFGEVTVIAPDSQRSAVSHHCIFSRPLMLKEYDFGLDGVKAFSLDGTPADCVRIGIRAMGERKPDVVLSGINHGFNISSDIQYSGTVGAALEADFQGVHSIAVSCGNCDFSAADIVDWYLPGLLEEYMDAPLPAGQVWNINFPDCRAEECRGIRRGVKMNASHFYDNEYSMEKIEDGTWSVSSQVRRNWDGPEDSDLYAVVHGFIAVGTVKNLE